MQSSGMPRNRFRQSASAVLLLTMLMAFAVQAASISASDAQGDVQLRRTDTDANGPVDQQNHVLPDLLEYKIGTWRPDNPQTDLYTGNWSSNGEFVRLDLIIDGLVNPPGPIGCCGEPAFDPFRYGPNPVSGYVEFDVDADINTGGELEIPDLRYQGVVARFGGLPADAVERSRVALDAGAFDGDLTTPPFVERNGEDFHFELVGWEVAAATFERSDTSDWLFGEGETWSLSGHFIHRSHAYTQFCSACCRSGSPLGSYEPIAFVRFGHTIAPDRTTVSLVYPLINDASGDLAGDPAEPNDIFHTNQNSILEALWELKISALSATPEDRALPEFELLAEWEYLDPDDYLMPTTWGVRILLGGSYTSAEDAYFAWCDLHPDVVRGDLDGNFDVNAADRALFDAALAVKDGTFGFDLDGMVDGSIVLADFGPGFSLYDLNYDGLVDHHDRTVVGGPALPIGDFESDSDLDQVDFAHLQMCLTSSQQAIDPFCRDADLNGDAAVDVADLQVFIDCAGGPGIPADPQCGRGE